MNAARACMLASALYAVAIAVVAASTDYIVQRDLWLCLPTGYGALAALFASLSMSPCNGCGDAPGDSVCCGARSVSLRPCGLASMSRS